MTAPNKTLLDDCQFEDGKLVKVGYYRPEYADGHTMIKLIRSLAEGWNSDRNKPAGKESTQRVHFRLIQMPCCGFHFCNVNPRLPNYCPECGEFVHSRIRESVLISDEQATLSLTD